MVGIRSCERELCRESAGCTWPKHSDHDLPHAVLDLLFDVDRSSVTRAIGQIRALLAEHGCAAPDHPGARLCTLEGAQAEGVELRLDTTEDIDSCSRYFPEVGVLFDDGYLGLRRDYPGKAITPPRKPNRSAPPEFHERWKHYRHAHSVDRITVEHALADHKRWKQLTRWTHRRENLPATSRAIARLASDCTTNT